MSQPTPTPAPTQPKIVHRLVVRTLVLILILGVCVKGYQWWLDKSGDITNLKPAQTFSWIAAVQYQQDGQQAIAISPDGKITPAPGWKTGKTDRDVTWNPSGNRIFFVTDREENNFHVFRWNPTDGTDPVQKSFGTRSHSLPMFTRQDIEGADDSALITSGGFVLEYVPKNMSTLQLLPPTGKEVSTASEDEGGGQSDQFSGAYSKLGNSFKSAQWCKGREWIAAIMRRDEGEVLILQYMHQDNEGKFPPPHLVAAGEHVEIDVNPADGTVIFAVQNFQWPSEEMIPSQFRKGNKVTRPFSHYLGKIDPGDGAGELPPVVPLAMSKDDKICFGSPTISPDGASVAFIGGPYKDGALESAALATAPIVPGGIQSKAVLATGKIHEPSWSPNGDLLVFAQDMPSGHRSLIEIHKDGSGSRNLTGDAGNYGDPVFSPQKQ